MAGMLLSKLNDVHDKQTSAFTQVHCVKLKSHNHNTTEAVNPPLRVVWGTSGGTRCLSFGWLKTLDAEFSPICGQTLGS